jgi:hypothetical protein
VVLLDHLVGLDHHGLIHRWSLASSTFYEGVNLINRLSYPVRVPLSANELAPTSALVALETDCVKGHDALHQRHVHVNGLPAVIR